MKATSSTAEEDPLPAESLRERAAHQRAHRHREAGGGAPEAKGRAALVRSELLRDQRQRGGEHHRPADALNSTEKVQHRRRRRQAAHQRGDHENAQTDDEYPAAA
jgi:hypothetical protein